MNIPRIRRLCVGIAVAALMIGPAAVAPAQQGTIAGQVTDQSTGAGVPAARILLGGTNSSAVTNADGRYTIAGVPAGTYEVRVAIIGYAGLNRRVTVGAGEIANADFALKPAAVSLDALVVTATGEQRARELANAVSTIKAAEVVQQAPITNLSDLLQGRAANVQVLQSGGTVGTGARVRIRGLNSLSLNNSPLYYIDGVRVESGDVNALSVNLGGQQPSRLNDLNPQEIESIEIVKGPSAATLYGTRAANGVIRITTKHGIAGKPRWLVYSELGTLHDGNTYADNYYAWGHTTPGNAVTQCLLTASAASTCAIDSVTKFNVMRNPATSPLGTGWRGQVGAQVSGGSEQTQYFVSGEYSDELGALRLPGAEYARIQAERNLGAGALPYEQYRPNEFKIVSLRSNVHATLTRTADLSVNVGFVQDRGRFPQNDNNITGLLGSALFGTGFQRNATVTGGNTFGGEWRFFRPGEVFAALTYQDISRLTGSATANWRPASWLTGRATVGLDYAGRTDIQSQANGEGPNFITFRQGRRFDNRFQITHYTVDASGTGAFALTPDLSSKTTVGVQYLKDLTFGSLANGQQLPPGAQTVTAAAIRTASETTIVAVTLGSFVEQVFGWKDRLFITGAVRRDQNSAFGQQFRSVYYPKLAASWVVSDEPGFPKAIPVNSMRLRVAYGASGQQPGPTDALRFFSANPATISGTDVSGVEIGALGNDSLKPERSAELELGLDAGFWQDKAHLELTYYHKKTTDALISRRLAPSLGGLQARFENIGSVLNKGIEGVLSLNFGVGSSAAVDLTLSGSRNTNQLLALGPGVQPIINGGQRHVPGYPLFGWWARPILSYSDANKNGIIELNEVTVGDTAVFLGSSLPRTEAALNAGVTLFNNRLRIGGQLDYRGDFLIENFTDVFRCTSLAANNCRAINDRTAPLADQAAAVVARNGSTGFSEAGFLQDGTFLKLRELSITYFAPDVWAHAMHASRVSFTVTGRNLATFTSYNGVDPEVNGLAQSDFTTDFLTAPPVRYWIFRVNLGF
jgi:TonB-linked SusC/RagA family outer membrane protein